MKLDWPDRPIFYEPHEYRGQAASRRRFTAEELVEVGGVATSYILGRLNRLHGYAVLVNHQPPCTIQGFHSDRMVRDGAAVIHASREGIFDFHPTANNAKQAYTGYKRIEIGQGDIVAQSKPHKYHRGGNPSLFDRYNMVVYRLGTRQH